MPPILFILDQYTSRAATIKDMKKAKTAADVLELEAIPNIGPAVAAYLGQVGIQAPADLKGQDPYVLFQQLCAQTGVSYDPCLLDTFIAAARFMAGEPPLPWWRYSRERKRTLKCRSLDLA
jgi:hypothetical protein